MPSPRDDSQTDAARVLLVDDERQVTEGLSLLLRGSSFVPMAAHSASEALRILREHDVDVIVSDECMPGMSGSELLSIVSREFPNTARVILTGQSTVASAIRAINHGQVFRYLQKPCSSEEFRTALGEAYSASKQARIVSRIMKLSPPQGTFSSHASDYGVNAASSAALPRLFDTFTHEAVASLSEREREVLALLVDGLRVAQIAKSLFISRHTVRNHLKALFSKLDVHSQAELLDRARGRSA